MATITQFMEFKKWILEQARQAKIKLSESRDEYSAGYSDAFRDTCYNLAIQDFQEFLGWLVKQSKKISKSDYDREYLAAIKGMTNKKG